MIEFDTREDLLRHIPPGGDCCEVGIFVSEFAEKIADICRPRRLILVDLFTEQTFSADVDGKNPAVVKRDYMIEAAIGVSKRYKGVEVYGGLSGDVLAQFPDDSLDFIYIDADHSYAGVTADLAQAWRLVRPGGFICGHDYTINPDRVGDTSYYAHFGVRQAVAEFLAAHGLSLYGVAMDGYTSFAIQVP
jgi:SAM-dependent methyltransferase